MVDFCWANFFMLLRGRATAPAGDITPTGTLVPSAIVLPPFRYRWRAGRVLRPAPSHPD